MRGAPRFVHVPVRTERHYLIEHEDLRRKMGRQARVDVERFRIEHIAEQWKELFEEALEK